MSKKRVDRPTGGRRDDDDGKLQSNKSARLDSGKLVRLLDHARGRSRTHVAGDSGRAQRFASSSPAAAPTILPSLSPAQRLYSDALISAFGLLDLRELISAHSSCRSWRDAAHKEPSRSITFHCDPARLSWFSASPLRHHVGEYSARPSACTLEQVAALSAFPSLTRVTIEVVFRSLTPLTKLRGRPKYAEAITATVAPWPSRLAYFNVGLTDHGHASVCAASQVLIDCIGRIGTLTELELFLVPPPPDSITLQPLLQLTQLQSLHLRGLYSLSIADCNVLKQLGSLTCLNLDVTSLSPQALDALCTPPHQLAALQRIDLVRRTTAAHVEALTRLPAISTLDLDFVDPAAVTLLPRFPHLRRLRLSMMASAFMPHLAQCPQLSALDIHWSQLTLTDLTEVTRSLTTLTSLRFDRVRFDGLEQPDSLACLRSLPQLRELRFVRCSGVRLVHLTDPAFTSLSSLRSLSTYLSADSAVKARSLFALPCNLMPQLTHVHVQVW